MKDADLTPRVKYTCACGECDTSVLVFLNHEKQYIRLQVGNDDGSWVIYLSMNQIKHLGSVLREMTPAPVSESELDC